MGAAPDYSDEIAREIDDEIRRIVGEAQERAACPPRRALPNDSEFVDGDAARGQ
jgi:hypothetical protein